MSGKRKSPTQRAKEMRRALITLIECIDMCQAFEDIEGGQGGYGPLYDACKAARIPLPENFRFWRQS